MPLPSMTVTGNFNDVSGDVDSSELVESPMAGARIQFRSNASPGSVIKWEDTLYTIGYVDAIVNSDGDVVLDDGLDTPVKLLARHDDLNIRHLQWQVRVGIPVTTIPPSTAGQMRAFWFNAVDNSGAVDLATVIAVPRLNLIYVTPGSPTPTTNPYPALDLFPAENLYPNGGVPYPALGLFPSLELYPDGDFYPALNFYPATDLYPV